MLAFRAIIRRTATAARIVGAAELAFLLFVLALAVVVRAVVDNGLDTALGQWIPHGSGLAGLLGIAAMALFLFTAVAGRLWCGYACPQTVYTEIFLWVERRIEGDRVARMRLDAQPASIEKFVKKAVKHTAWIAIALWTGYTFVGYFTPLRDLALRVVTADLGPWESFWILFYAFATYGNAGWMREQVCTYMCPYARFQGVMFDHDTMIIAYDTARGDPRGARSRSADPRAKGLGDCVDCEICVQVCPTGIDIRNG